ncbi:hypothetical protein [uncultured Draconibacterium sp.]|uniref:hypothetical protein n=1 Tax=uncultured Draconibacterium sp. TaxID=1573823 RepID=UPI0025DD365C|nr:hypothetical protein [uncultured Draconibacterium sp.]
MSTTSSSNHPSVLILADFSDGSWYAASFAMQYLYNGKAPITIMQTYQSPGWGHFMMRKLSHHLKKISKNELKALKHKLVTHFKIDKRKVNTLNIEGELNFVLSYMPDFENQYNMVLSTYSSFNESCNRQNGCLQKIIDTAKNPIFIIPEKFEGGDTKKILFVVDSEKEPKNHLCAQLAEICNKTQSSLEILRIEKQKDENFGKPTWNYQDNFEGISIATSFIQHHSKCRGINSYLQNTNRDLIVIDHA